MSKVQVLGNFELSPMIAVHVFLKSDGISTISHELAHSIIKPFMSYLIYTLSCFQSRIGPINFLIKLPVDFARIPSLTVQVSCLYSVDSKSMGPVEFSSESSSLNDNLNTLNTHDKNLNFLCYIIIILKHKYLH